MTAVNDITGDKIITKKNSDSFRDGWDRIFKGPKIDTAKTPTLKEKVEVYEQLLHDIQLHAEVTMDSVSVRLLIAKICNWSYTHRAGNGENSEAVQNKMINKAFWDLKT